jgi:uncharacterized protein HemX
MRVRRRQRKRLGFLGNRNPTVRPTTASEGARMSTTIIVLIVIAAIVVIGVVLYLGKRRREAQLEERRVEAGERRDLAETKAREAEQARLAAEEQAARARAREAEAEAHRREADELDPDVDVDADADDVDERAKT